MQYVRLQPRGGDDLDEAKGGEDAVALRHSFASVEANPSDAFASVETDPSGAFESAETDPLNASDSAGNGGSDTFITLDSWETADLPESKPEDPPVKSHYPLLSETTHYTSVGHDREEDEENKAPGSGEEEDEETDGLVGTSESIARGSATPPASESATESATESASASAASPRTPLPWRQVAVVGAVLFADTFSQLVIFPFLPFMTADFFPGLRKEEIGYYAGYVGGSYAAALLHAAAFLFASCGPFLLLRSFVSVVLSVGLSFSLFLLSPLPLPFVGFGGIFMSGSVHSPTSACPFGRTRVHMLCF